MGEGEPWAIVRILGAAGDEVARRTVAGTGAPDLAAVDEVARLALLAARLGGRAVLAGAMPALRELVALAALPVEVEGEPEGREEPLAVEQRQEERHVGDLPA